MDSRKRVLRALMHNETDRVPIDMGGKQSVIHIKAYKRLLDYLDIEDKNKNFYDYAQQLAHPCNFLPEGHEPDRE